MKNKNKHIGNNDCLFESKFVYKMQKHHLYNYEEATIDEDKYSAAEGAINDFNRRFAPGEIPHATGSIDSIVHGVRHSLMQGPLADLNAEGILNERVRSKLEWARRNAPEHYKQIIDEMARAEIGANPTIMGRIWNTLTFRRQKVEGEVARRLFSYNIQAGENYETLTNDIEGDMLGLGNVAINGVNVNFGNINEVSTFNIAVGNAGAQANAAAVAGVGEGGATAGKQVVIEWYSDDYDYDRIKRNLARAGAWEPFMQTPAGREFMQLKWRHSLLTKYNNEERAKLTVDRYKKTRLENWLQIETSRIAMQDEQYVDWVIANQDLAAPGPNHLNFYADAADMQAGNDPLYQELQNQQRLAEQRVERNALKGMLRDILKPGLIDELEDSDEMKALLAYLQSEYEDELDGPRINEFIRSLAGRTGNVDDLAETDKTWGDAEQNLTAIMGHYRSQFNDYLGYNDRITSAKDAITRAERAARGGAALNDLNNQLNSLQEAQASVANSLTDNAWEFLRFINNQHDPAAVAPFTPLQTQINALLVTTINYKGVGTILTHTLLTQAPSTPGARRDFIRTFSGFINNVQFFNNIDELKKVVDENKKESQSQLDVAKEYAGEGKAEKMDARGLLSKLVERDIKARGIDSESNLQSQTFFATNALIAQSQHNEMHGHTNKHAARTLEGSWFGRQFRNSIDRFIPQGWMSVLSAKDVLGHVVDSDPDLVAFSRINVLSSRKDLMKAIKRHGDMTPEKLREMQEKLALFISGIEVPTDNETVGTAVRKFGEKASDVLHLEDTIRPGNRRSVFGKKFRVRSDEAPMLENIIHLLSLLESQLAAERSLKTINADVKDMIANGEEVNRSQLQLQHLEEQTEASQATDNSIAALLENEQSFFRKRLLFKRLRKEFYEAMEETRGMPWDERDQELAKLGFSKRVRAKGIFSMRARWWTKEIGKETIKLPFKIAWGGLKGFGRGFVKGYEWLYGADTWKRSTKATNESLKATLRFPFTLVGGLLYNYPVKILSAAPRWLDDTAVKSTNKSYAAINQETQTNPL